MKKRKVLVVLHVSLMPPESLEGFDDKAIQEWRAEYDVITTLKALGHEVRVLGVLDSLVELRALIADWQPDIVFNLLEEFDGIVSYDQHVIAFLEMLRQPYTGCNPRGLLLSRDKILCKQVFAYHRIPTPQFEVFRRTQKVRVPKRLRYPLFVKSATDDASLGIAQASVVEDAVKLRERIEFVFEQNKSDVLVEEYIEGRECYVGVIGNERLARLPVWELDFGTMPATQAAIATRKVKWDLDYRRRYGIGSRPAENLPARAVVQLDRLSRRIFRALGLSGFARMDFRVREDGSVFVLEANANPHLATHEDFARSAQVAGIGYPALIDRILALGLSYRSEWRVLYG
jgi:D-alanine-D-alanine ligase